MEAVLTKINLQENVHSFVSHHILPDILTNGVSAFYILFNFNLQSGHSIF